MRHLTTFVLSFAGASALAGCVSDEELVAPRWERVNASAAVAERPARHLVVLRGADGVPADLAARVAAAGGRVEWALPEIGVVTVTGLSEAGAAALRRHGGVVSVDRDFRLPLPAAGRTDVQDVPDAMPASPAAPQTAALFARQWNMRAIGADQAWAAGVLGSAGVTVAILDTGIDHTLVDLSGRVDLARSASFVPEDNPVVTALFPGRPFFSDLDGHGTNVATQVASNAIVFAGVTSQPKLLAVKVCSVFGYCDFGAVLAGVVHAVGAGADVINLSLGAYIPKRECRGCTSIFNRVAAFVERAGVTVVTAAGNEEIDLDRAGNLYNAFCDVIHVICVAATGATGSGPSFAGPFPDIDSPALYTNFGRSAISVAAPGGNFTLNDAGQITSAARIYSLCPKTALAYDPETKQISLTLCSAFPQLNFASAYVGTSQASPHVAGLAALLVERLGRNPAHVRARLLQTADDLGQPGKDPYYGRGRVNVAKALGIS